MSNKNKKLGVQHYVTNAKDYSVSRNNQKKNSLLQWFNGIVTEHNA